jgi:LuxR family transcriptional regulator, maltose regulon positive regulatory protein
MEMLVQVESKWCATGRFVPPANRLGVLHRARLWNAKSRQSAPRLTVVQAPLGYGKTTLLAQWYEELRGARERVGWLTLTAADRAPEHLTASLRAALEASSGGQETFPCPSAETLFAFLSSHPTVLFLDRWDEILGSDGVALVARLVDAALSGCRFVIAGRRHCGLALGPLRLSGELRMIDREALRFTGSEQRRLLGTLTTFDDIPEILSACDGWPLALQLLRLIHQDDRNGTGNYESFCRRSGLSQFVHDELTERLTTEERSIAAIAGLFERLEAPLLDEILNRSDSGAVLESLAQLWPIIPETDGETLSYVPLPILRRLLRTRFEMLGNDTRTALAQRAALVYAAHARLLEAIEFALVAGLPERVVELAEQAGPMRLMMMYGIAPLQGVFRNLPPALLARSPRLQLLHSLMYSKQGCFSEARRMLDGICVEVADAQASVRECSPLTLETIFARTQLAAYSDRAWGQDFETFARRRLAQDPTFAAWSRLCSGILEHQLGNLSKADQELQKSAVLFTNFRARYQLLHLELHAAHILLARGEHREAVRAFRNVLRQAHREYPFDAGLYATANIGRMEAESQADPGCIDTAALHGALLALQDSEGWFEPFASAYRLAAQCTWRAEGLAGVLRLLDDAESYLARQAITHIETFLPALRIYFLLLAGRDEEAETLAARSRWRESQTAGAKSTQLFWRERHLRGQIEAMLLQRRGQVQAAFDLLDRLAADARRDGRMVSLIEALMQRAHALSLLDRADERIWCSLSEALTLACRLKAYGPVFDWRDLIENHLAAPKAQLPHNVQKFIGGLRRHWGCAGRSAHLLSDTELSSLTDIAQGRTNKEIGRRLAISANTVKYHLKRVFAKLNVPTRRAAVATAKREGLLGATSPRPEPQTSIRPGQRGPDYSQDPKET